MSLDSVVRNEKVLQAYRIVAKSKEGRIFYYSESFRNRPADQLLQDIANKHNALVYVESMDYGSVMVH